MSRCYNGVRYGASMMIKYGGPFPQKLPSIPKVEEPKEEMPPTLEKPTADIITTMCSGVVDENSCTWDVPTYSAYGGPFYPPIIQPNTVSYEDVLHEKITAQLAVIQDLQEKNELLEDKIKLLEKIIKLLEESRQ